MGTCGDLRTRDRTAEELACQETLREFALPTGGRQFVAEHLREAVKIGIELRCQYVRGYSPVNQIRDGKYRKITVKVIPPYGTGSLHAFRRNGCFAPTQ